MSPEPDKLPMPNALTYDLRTGKHSISEKQLAVLASMVKFLERPVPDFYDLKSIAQENGLWTRPYVHYYVGARNASHPPGDIDPALALIIGEAGPDSPIALDYRTSPPRVLYLGTVDRRSCWIELCASYEQLMSMLPPDGENQ